MIGKFERKKILVRELPRYHFKIESFPTLQEILEKADHLSEVLHQDLLRYNIIDLTPKLSTAIKELLGSGYDYFIRNFSTEDHQYNNSVVLDAVDKIASGCKSLDMLKHKYKSNKKEYIKPAEDTPPLQSTYGRDVEPPSDDLSKAFELIKLFYNQKIPKLNKLNNTKQSEMDYVLDFIGPTLKILLEKEDNVGMMFGEKVLQASQDYHNANIKEDSRRELGSKSIARSILWMTKHIHLFQTLVYWKYLDHHLL